MSLTTKTKIIIGVVAGVVAAGGVTGGIIAYNNTPKALLTKAFKNTQSDFENSEYFNTMNSIYESGSINVDLDMDVTPYYSYYDSVSNPVNIVSDTTLYMNGNYNYAITSENSSDGETLNFEAYISSENIVFQSDRFYDEALGVDISSLSETLPGSIYDPAENTEYALDSNIYDYLLNFYDYLTAMETVDDEAKALVDDYRNMLISSVIENSEISKSSEKLDVGDDTVKCTAIEINTDGEQFALILEDIIEYAQDDEKLEEIVEKYAALYSLYEDQDDLVDEFYDMLDEFLDSLEDSEEDLEDAEILTIVYVSKGNTRVAGIEFSVDLNMPDAQDFELEIILGKDINTTNYMSYTVKEGSRFTKCEYIVEEDSDDYYESSVIFTIGGSGNTEKIGFTFEYDKDSGEFEFYSIKDWKDQIKVEGTRTEDGSEIIIEIEKITGDEIDDTIDINHFIITINKNADFPEVPDFTDLISLDEDELNELTENIADYMGLSDIMEDYEYYEI